MLVVGLTGGIASGKTTVANLFAEEGISIIDTDIIARNLVAPGLPAHKKILDHFSNDVLKSDDSIDRAKLREIVFSDHKEKKWLEDLLHPMIRETVNLELSQAQSPYCMVVIPLLLETWPNPVIDRVLVVETSPEIQIQRVINRDEISQQQAMAILQTQASNEERRTIADDIIYNNTHAEQLTDQVKVLHEKYLRHLK